MIPTLHTERLLLRPFSPRDVPAVLAHCGNWDVARMLARVPHPYSRDLAAGWIESHADDWQRGIEAIFCIDSGGDAIGAVGLRLTAPATYELGYWLGEPWWGAGFATESGRRIVTFAFDELRAEKLTSGHYVDNPASGRVLEKCGFRHTGESVVPCQARGEAVAHRNYELIRAGQAGKS